MAAPRPVAIPSHHLLWDATQAPHARGGHPPLPERDR